MTSAPIDIEHLKRYFSEDNIFFIIDYDESSLKGNELLTYLGNLDVPCDVSVSSDSVQDLLSCYLESDSIVSIPYLEDLTLDLILQIKGITDPVATSLIEDNKEQLLRWNRILESTALYNVFTINDKGAKDWVASHKEDPTSSLKGVNFVNLLKHIKFNDIFDNMIEEPVYFSSYFNDYIFKGKNLFHYWANSNNYMFLSTTAVAAGDFDYVKYNESIQQEIQEVENAASI